MARVTRGLFDHVHQYPAQRDVTAVLVLDGALRVERRRRGDDRARTHAGIPVLREDRLDGIVRAQAELAVVVPHRIDRLPGEVLTEPAVLDGREVRDDAEDREAR